MIEVTIKLLDTDEFGGLFKWFSRSEWAWMIDKSINYRKWMSMKYSLNLIVDEPKMWNLSSLKCHSSKMYRSKCDEIGFYYLLGVMWSKSILYIDRESLRSTVIPWSHDPMIMYKIPWSQDTMIPWSCAKSHDPLYVQNYVPPHVTHDWRRFKLDSRR